MNKVSLPLVAGLALGMTLVGFPLAQDATERAATHEGPAIIQVVQNEEYGQYLADGGGRALYLFTDDTQGTDTNEPEVSCSGGCLENWPPLYTNGDPQGGEGVDATLLKTVDLAGQAMVTYNGWPLYYFAGDEEPGQTNGQERGDKWYLVSPAGEAIHSD